MRKLCVDARRPMGHIRRCRSSGVPLPIAGDVAPSNVGDVALSFSSAGVDLKVGVASIRRVNRWRLGGVNPRPRLAALHFY